MVALPASPPFGAKRGRPSNADRATLVRETAALDLHRRQIVEIPLELISPSPANPRQHYDQAALEALAESLLEHGQLQPCVVRPGPGPTRNYLLVAGERRYRAAQLADLPTLDCVIRAPRDARDTQLIALAENLQREDLNPIEEAKALAQLVALGASQAQIARSLGRSPSAISNAMRLLQLPDEAQQLIARGELTASHGIALLSRGLNAGARRLNEAAQQAATTRTSSKALRDTPDRPWPEEQDEPGDTPPAAEPPQETQDPAPPRPVDLHRANLPPLSVANVMRGLVPGASVLCPHCGAPIAFPAPEEDA